MNFTLHNQDLRILQAEAKTPRFGRTPAWMQVDWKPTHSGGNMIYLRQLTLPLHCSVERTDIKIEAPPNLYEPVGRGRLAFYRNLWISPGIRLFDRKRRRMVGMPRLFGRDADGFAFLCLHPDPVEPGKNILDFIRVVDLFLLNPGYKAGIFDVL
jgi:hypothetical protein